MKTSCFSLSAPLIKENIRRFWPLPAVAFLTYCITGIIPVLAGYKKTDALASFVNTLLHQQYHVYSGLALIIPVIAASLVFRYLYNNSSAAIMHALPITRGQLFNSSFCSGLFFSIVPVILTGLLLLCLARPLYFSEHADYMNAIGSINESAILNHSNVFTYRQVFVWLGETLTAVLCAYTISVFAAVIAGSGIIHFFTALVLNFLVTGLMVVIAQYFSAFLFGFIWSEQTSSVINSLSPIYGIISHKGEAPLILILCYLVLAVLLTVVSFLLYKKRRLERTQKAFIISIIDPIVCYIITFFGMTVAGLLLFRNEENDWTMYLGFIGGSIAAFIIGRMIVTKSLRIFNRKAVKSFLIYAVAAVCFLSILAFDLTGYETRLPSAGQVTKIAVNDGTLLMMDPRFDSSYYKGDKGREIYKTKENIRAIIDLQQSIIDNKQESSLIADDTSPFELHYYKSAADLQRSYWVQNDFFRNNANYKTIYESKEFKDFYSLYNLKKFKKSELSISSAFTYNDLPLKKKDKDELIKCIEQDFRERTFEEQVNKRRPCGMVNLTYKTIIPGSGVSLDGISLNILTSDTHTMEWIKKHKYSREFNPTADDIKDITVYAADPKNRAEAADEALMMELDDASYYEKIGSIKNKKKMNQILNTCETTPDIIACKITFKRNRVFDGETNTYYFSEESAPDFLKEMIEERT